MCSNIFAQLPNELQKCILQFTDLAKPSEIANWPRPLNAGEISFVNDILSTRLNSFKEQSPNSFLGRQFRQICGSFDKYKEKDLAKHAQIIHQNVVDSIRDWSFRHPVKNAIPVDIPLEDLCNDEYNRIGIEVENQRDAVLINFFHYLLENGSLEAQAAITPIMEPILGLSLHEKAAALRQAINAEPNPLSGISRLGFTKRFPPTPKEILKFTDLEGEELQSIYRFSAMIGNAETLKEIHKSGRFGEIPTFMLGHALYYAADSGYLSIIQALLSSNRFNEISPNVLKKALREATSNGYLSIILTLISSEKLDSIIFGCLNELLNISLTHDHLPIARMLIASERFDLISLGKALVSASANRHLPIVQQLIASKRFKDIDFMYIKKAMDIAKKIGHSSIVQALRDSGRLDSISADWSDLYHELPGDLQKYIFLFTDLAKPSIMAKQPQPLRKNEQLLVDQTWRAKAKDMENDTSFLGREFRKVIAPNLINRAQITHQNVIEEISDWSFRESVKNLIPAGIFLEDLSHAEYNRIGTEIESQRDTILINFFHYLLENGSLEAQTAITPIMEPILGLSLHEKAAALRQAINAEPNPLSGISRLGFTHHFPLIPREIIRFMGIEIEELSGIYASSAIAGNIETLKAIRVSPDIQIYALYHAAREGRLSSVQFLIDSPNFHEISRRDLGFIICEARRVGHFSVVQTLINTLRFRELVPQALSRVLMEACNLGHFYIVRLLLKGIFMGHGDRVEEALRDEVREDPLAEIHFEECPIALKLLRAIEIEHADLSTVRALIRSDQFKKLSPDYLGGALLLATLNSRHYIAQALIESPRFGEISRDYLGLTYFLASLNNCSYAQTIPLSPDELEPELRLTSQDCPLSPVQAFLGSSLLKRLNYKYLDKELERASAFCNHSLIQAVIISREFENLINEPYDLLTNAASDGHFFLVQAFISSGMIQAVSSYSRGKALLKAFEAGHHSIVRELSKLEGIDRDILEFINPGGFKRYSLDKQRLIMASEAGHLCLVNVFLGWFDVSADAFGEALIRASKAGHLPIVQAFIASTKFAQISGLYLEKALESANDLVFKALIETSRGEKLAIRSSLYLDPEIALRGIQLSEKFRAIVKVKVTAGATFALTAFTVYKAYSDPSFFKRNGQKLWNGLSSTVTATTASLWNLLKY